MSRSKRVIGFSGLRRALAEQAIPPTSAADALNYDLEQGTLKNRYGWKSLRSPQASFSASYGLAYLAGYNASYAEVDEYITFENLGAGVQAYSRASTGLAAPAAITGAGSLSSAGNWRGYAWDNRSYFLSPAFTSVYKHVIGDNTSWTAFQPAVTPAAALTYAIRYQTTADAAYATVNFAGVATGENTYTGCATATSLLGDNSLLITNAITTTSVTGSIKIDFSTATAGAQDWQYNDVFAFALTPQDAINNRISTTGVKVTIYNTAGAAYTATKCDVVFDGNAQFFVRAQFDGKTRADWSSIKYFMIEYTFSRARVGTQYLRLTPITVGCCVMKPPVGRTQDSEVQFAYSYYDSTNLLESGLSPAVSIPAAQLAGLNPVSGLMEGLGCWVYLSPYVASASVDKTRTYWSEGDGIWHRVVEQNDTTSNYTVKQSYLELLSAAIYTPRPYQYTNVVAACPFKGWMVWFYKAGFENVRHSRVGDPEKLEDTNNTLQDGDGNRAATYSLADNFSDQPLGGVQAHDALVIFGSQGVYAQVGDSPSSMTPAKKLPGSFGCVGYDAFSRWKSDAGGPGAVWLSQNGEVYFAEVSQAFDGDTGFRVTWLTEAASGIGIEYLITGQSGLSYTVADLANAMVVVDEKRDALWVILGKRALVLQRPSKVTGTREWVPYEFNTGGSTTVIKHASFSSRRRNRALLSDGRFIEFEWDTANNTYITGSNRDGGNAMTAPYWKSGVQLGDNRRVDHVAVNRATLTDTPTVQIISTRATNSYTLASGKIYTRTAFTQQGPDHQFKITGGENFAEITSLEWEEKNTSKRFNQ